MEAEAAASMDDAVSAAPTPVAAKLSPDLAEYAPLLTELGYDRVERWSQVDDADHQNT